MNRARSLLLIVTVIVGAKPAQAQFENVGSFEFPTSASAEAQNHFLRGAAFLHSFGWIQAREEFHAAQEIDPNFAMAYWGESLAYNHPLTLADGPERNREEPSSGWLPLAPSRLAKAPTEREKGFLNAVEILWGEGDHVQRRVGYMDAMSHLYEQYPNDTEVAAFYALSMLSASTATRDLTQRLNVTGRHDLLESVRAQPETIRVPPIIRFTPSTVPCWLRSGSRPRTAFPKSLPPLLTLVHMPTHIFIQHGMWDRVSGNNESAYTAARELWKPEDPIGDAKLSTHWIGANTVTCSSGTMRRGGSGSIGSRAWRSRVPSSRAAREAQTGRRSGRSNGVPLLKARYVVETEEWEVRPITDESSMHELLATGLSAARTGDQATVAQAEAALKEMAEPRSERKHETPASCRRRSAPCYTPAVGHGAVATGLMDEAQAIVEEGPVPRGAASPVKPVYELYGEILLDLDRPADAIEKFETSLLRLPNRPRSLLGLARAYAKTGNREMAAEAYKKLTAAWAGP